MSSRALNNFCNTHVTQIFNQGDNFKRTIFCQNFFTTAMLVKYSTFQRRIIYLIVIKKRQSDLGSPILYPLSDTEKASTNFVCDFLKLTATLMPKQAQRIDIILPFYPFELKLYFSSPRPTYFWERRQSQDCNAEKRMGNATGQILHLINIPLTTCILVYLYT